MAFLETVFRRRAADDLSGRAETPADEARSASKQTPAGGSKLYRWSFVIHKWAGLVGFAWLAVLGATGFLMDHDDWRWMQQGKAPAWLTPVELKDFAARNVVRFHQIDPEAPANRVAGGPRGLWASADGGTSWTATRFFDGDTPQIAGVTPDPALGWGRLWFATDNGVYRSLDRGRSAEPAGLAGEHVTAIAAGERPDRLLLVVDKSRILRFGTEDGKTEEVALAPLDAQTRPPSVDLIHFVHDLHFGRAFFDPLTSLVMNDIGGLGMVLLSITGFLYWGLPKYWKHQGRESRRASKTTKKATIKWLFRLHSPTIGLVSVAMLLYLSVTGVLLGHGRELLMWMRSVEVPQAWLTPAFALKSWDGWIESIVAYPGAPGVFTIGSRIGMFTTADGGETFAREEDARGRPVVAAARLRRLGDKVLVANGMAGPSTIRPDDRAQEIVAAPEKSRMLGVPGPGGARPSMPPDAAARKKMGMGGMEGMFMPTDVTQLGDRLLWKSSNKFFVTDAQGRSLDSFETGQPADAGVPWINWILRLHMGTLFWSEFKWINDLFAIGVVLLSVTGLVRWWRKKWV
jgi:hypothetical protein